MSWASPGRNPPTEDRTAAILCRACSVEALARQGASRGQQRGPLARRALPALALARRCLFARWARGLLSSRLPVPAAALSVAASSRGGPTERPSGRLHALPAVEPVPARPSECLAPQAEGRCGMPSQPLPVPAVDCPGPRPPVLLGGFALRGVLWQQNCGFGGKGRSSPTCAIPALVRASLF